MRTEEGGNALAKFKEEFSAEAAAKAKEERIELLRRQSMRRMLNAGLANAWSAWFELWEAKTYAMGRLRECGNRLHKPALANSFSFWFSWWRELKREEYEVCTTVHGCTPHSMLAPERRLADHAYGHYTHRRLPVSTPRLALPGTTQGLRISSFAYMNSRRSSLPCTRRGKCFGRRSRPSMAG